jgi:DNA polymerase-3 subunit delta
MSAGNLTKSSALRLFCETHPKILAIACYQEEAKDVAAFIRETLGSKGVQVSTSAMPMMVERLSENRLATRSELDKLICYLGDKKTVDVTDVQAIITDTQNSSVDTFCCAVATGQREVAEKEYHLMIENGENPVSIIRILYLYFNKLLDAAEAFETAGMAAAVKKIMKPAQFRLESSFQKQIQIWKKSFIFKVLSLLIDAERQAKSTGLPADLILDRVILQIAGVAQRYKM